MQVHSFHSTPSQIKAIFRNFLALFPVRKKKIETWNPSFQLALIGSIWIPEQLPSVTAEQNPTDTSSKELSFYSISEIIQQTCRLLRMQILNNKSLS